MQGGGLGVPGWRTRGAGACLLKVLGAAMQGKGYRKGRLGPHPEEGLAEAQRLARSIERWCFRIT